MNATSYITTHFDYLKQYHYIQNATKRWFNFHKQTLDKYIAEYSETSV